MIEALPDVLIALAGPMLLRDFVARWTRSLRVLPRYFPGAQSTNARYANWYTVFGRIGEPRDRHKGISCFVVPRDAPGVSVGRKEDKLGQRSSDTSDVIFDEVKLNASPPRLGRKTGNLQNSIYWAYSPERSTDGQKTYRISWNKSKAPHGHLIEFGTSRAPAHPFVRPAFSRVNEAIRIVTEKPTGAPSMDTEVCLDAATDRELMEFGLRMSKDVCTRFDMKRAGTNLVIDSECSFGPVSSTTRTTMSGDFQSTYTIRIEGKTDGLPLPNVPKGPQEGSAWFLPPHQPPAHFSLKSGAASSMPYRRGNSASCSGDQIAGSTPFKMPLSTSARLRNNPSIPLPKAGVWISWA